MIQVTVSLFLDILTHFTRGVSPEWGIRSGLVQAYSWGVVENGFGDGLFCGSKNAAGATVISVQNMPYPEIRDNPLDEVADATDGHVASPIDVGEFATDRFLDVVIIPDPIRSLSSILS